LGEFGLAIEHFEKALALFVPERHREDVFLYSQNPGVSMLCHAAWALWCLGKPDQAVAQMQEALNLAHELREPHGLAHSFYHAAVLHQFRREARLAKECAEQALAAANEHGLVMYQAYGLIVQGWAQLDQGREEEAIAQMHQGLAVLQTMGADVARPHFLALLA